MTTWSADDVRRIAETDDLRVSPFRADGVTYGTPTWVMADWYQRDHGGWYQRDVGPL